MHSLCVRTVMPNAYTSEPSVARLPVSSSGAIHASVPEAGPAAAPVRAVDSEDAERPPSSRLIPKSCATAAAAAPRPQEHLRVRARMRQRARGGSE